MRIPSPFATAPRTCSSVLFAVGQLHELVAGSGRALHQLALGLLPVGLFLLSTTTREQIYNVLWALVFGFATLNILSLGARRFEQKSGLNFGEVLAILVVVVSIVLLGWEMLYTFHVLPIRLAPR
jgi:hypothetical protein